MLAFLTYPELRILALTYGATVELLDGTLEVVGTECVYNTSAGADLTDNSRLGFIQNTRCNPLRGTPTGDLKLIVRLAERHRIGVGALVPIAPEADQGPNSIRVIGAPGGGQGTFPVLRGSYIEYLPHTLTRRVDLLAYMWQIQPVTWIWQMVGFACGLFFVGAIVTPHTYRAEGDTRWLSAGRAALGTGCAAAALGLMYAVLVPPLHAPDEPHHLLSYRELTGDGSLPEDVIQWAELGHLQRIRFNKEERFRPSNIGMPLATTARYIWPEDVLARSTTTTEWWRLLSRFIGHQPVPKKLLILRFANVLLFAIAAALGALLLQYASHGQAHYPQLLPSFLLLIPTLPFFAMHMSEFATLTSVYVLLATSTLTLFVDSPRSSWAGFPLGLAISLAIIGGRSALPMLPLILCILGARSVLGCRGVQTVQGQTACAAIFWGGLAASGTVVFLLDHSEFFNQVQSTILKSHGALAPAVERALRHPQLAFAIAPAGFFAELLSAKLRAASPVRRFATGPLAACVRWVCYGGAVLVVISFLVSTLVAYPHIPDLDGPIHPLRADYLRSVINTAASSFRLTDADRLLSASFWVGFGWVDTLPGPIFLTLLVGGAGLSLISLLVHLGRARDVRRATWLGIVGIGWWVTLAAYALATYGMQRNLHGRYLIGAYLTVLAVIFSSIGLTGPVRFAERIGITRPAVTLMLAGAVHSYCLWFVLARYF